MSGPGLGHNKPPEIIEPSDPEILRARLEREYKDMFDRFSELEVGAGQVPDTITSDAEASRTVDWVASQCKALIARAEHAHAKEKKPYLEGGRLIDRIFNDRIKRLNNIIGPITRRVERYFEAKKIEMRRREEAARREAAKRREAAEAEATRLAAEARERDAAGDRKGAVALTQEAIEAQTEAELAAAREAMPPASVNIHGEYGATAFSREVWAIEVMDPALVPLGYLTLDEDAVRAAIRDGITEIPGLRIYKTDKFVIRRC